MKTENSDFQMSNMSDKKPKSIITDYMDTMNNPKEVRSVFMKKKSLGTSEMNRSTSSRKQQK